MLPRIPPQCMPRVREVAPLDAVPIVSPVLPSRVRVRRRERRLLDNTQGEAVHDLLPSKRTAVLNVRRRAEERDFVAFIASARRRADRRGSTQPHAGDGVGVARDASPRPSPRAGPNAAGPRGLIAGPLQELANKFPFLTADLVHVSGRLPAHAVLDPLDGERVTRGDLAAEARRQAYTLLEAYMQDRAAFRRLRTDVSLLASCRARLHANTRPRHLLDCIRAYRRAMREERARMAAARIAHSTGAMVPPALRRSLLRYIWRYRRRKSAGQPPEPAAPEPAPTSSSATPGPRKPAQRCEGQRSIPRRRAAARGSPSPTWGRQLARNSAEAALPPLPPVAQSLYASGSGARATAAAAPASASPRSPRARSLQKLERGIDELSDGLQARIRMRTVAAVLRGKPSHAQTATKGRPNLVLYDERLVQRIRRRGAGGEMELDW